MTSPTKVTKPASPLHEALSQALLCHAAWANSPLDEAARVDMNEWLSKAEMALPPMHLRLLRAFDRGLKIALFEELCVSDAEDVEARLELFSAALGQRTSAEPSDAGQ
jgi:glutathione S-transferase